jgi:porphobilinogen synthase
MKAVYLDLILFSTQRQLMTEIPCFGAFPAARMRRNRRWPWLREMLQETHFSPANLIWPVFVIDGVNQRQAISSMPGVERLSVDLAVKAAERAASLGVSSVAIFPVTPPEKKSDDGKHAMEPDNLICRATRAITEKLGTKIGIVCDVALDPYTTHGHDGLLIDGVIVNDETTEILCKQAVNQATAGATVIAPSDMMDGRIGEIRKALDQAGYQDVIIMSYAAKYASAFYGPFREAVGSATNLGKGDKKTYQMNPANTDEALREVAMDLNEGADIVMVKPGLPYLDIIRRLHDAYHVPIAAYQVSGEYAMLKFASQNGAIQEKECVLESLLAFRRAGATSVLSYYALQAAEWLGH